VHKPEIRAEVLRRRAAGQTLRSIASDLGLAVRTVHDWTRAGPLERRSTRCWRCTPFTAGPDIGWAYAYLLGQYLGDGHPLIRGLIHSDGCRAMNRVVVRGKRYS
jgi:hypothetical protein